MDCQAEDSKASRDSGCGCARRSLTMAAAVSLALSLGALAACSLLSVNARDTKSRVLALERIISDGAGGSGSEELHNTVQILLQERLSELMPKLRKTRDVGQECVCPPGPPGKRGRMGRRGDPGPPVSSSHVCLLFHIDVGMCVLGVFELLHLPVNFHLPVKATAIR
ncbi:collagen alpha-1(XXIII) chain-like [Trichomycterus rosablanca]|uniref:collagen alpha-1(XXIII) chain-like n=1 Tax=Trichomycterus rosablanca TaxID=2290929 RepID=UPI002F35B7A6